MGLKVLVHHVADADGGDDFEEVGGQASVQPRRTLGLQDLPEEAIHRHLLFVLCCGCKKNTLKHSVSG